MRRTAGIVLLALLVLGLAGLLAGCGIQKDIQEGTSGNIDLAKDTSTKLGINAIQTGIVAYIGASQTAPASVDAATLGNFVQPWPDNPWTLQPMQEGTTHGDYTYTNLGGMNYKISGHLSDGSLYTKP